MRRGEATRMLLISVLLLSAATLMLAACGGGGIKSDELSSVVEQSVAAAVAAAVPEAAPAGPSAAEISAMVQQAVESAAPEGVSAAEIGTLVEAAVSAATEPAVSATEIESLVTQAVEQAAAGAATPLSASEVEAIVAAAVAAIPEPEPVVIAQPTAAPAMEGVMVLAGGTHRAVHSFGWGSLAVIDPASSVSHSPSTYLVWDQLVALEAETGRAVPELAGSWESNSDATEFTFNLRQGVTYSDGMPLTAKDVLYTAMHQLDPDTGAQFGADLEIVDADRITTPDDHTIVFPLNSANVDFPLMMTNRNFRIVPDGSGIEIKDNPIGTGPFTVQSYDIDAVTVLNSRDEYWMGTPLLGTITVVSIGDADARINATLAGQIDMVGISTAVTPAQASLFEGDPEFYIQESPRGQLMIIAPMITTEAPYDNPLVREALKLVVDPVEMIAIAAQGHGVPACNSPAWPADQYYLPVECPQDIDRAIELLAEAGYPDGLTIEYAASNMNPLWIPIATVYKAQAALAGITVDIVQVPADAYWTTTWMIHPFASSSWRFRQTDALLSVAFRCGAKWNETFWCNPEMDSIMDQARAELDFDTRKELYQETQRIIADEGGMIAPFIVNQIRVINSRLQGLPENAIDETFPYHEMFIVEP